MQRCVNVIGVGMSAFSPAAAGPGLADLIGRTARLALLDAGLSASRLSAVYAATDSDASLQRALEHCGLGQVAVRQFAPDSEDSGLMLSCAWQALVQDQAQAILVVGVQGAIGPWPYPDALLEHLGASARAYMARYQARPETFAMIAVKACQHAALNPEAAFRRALTLDQVLQARLLAEPLTSAQFAWPSAGVAAVLLCSADFARLHCPGPQVRILALASASPTEGIVDIGYDTQVAAARELYELAGIGPQDVQVCELHDASTLSEMLLYEALGFCPEGSAEKLVEEGDNTYGGNLVVNPSGGLLSLGLAGAASPLAQCIELVQQLRGSAGRRQVDNARTALQQHTADAGTVIATLYQRD
ncbi:thiolase C-terminal domain-containing protein [Pseudomonas sp. NPDC087612]|uniref:thiolase C-terminal domain-containing protein n=1 Tax=Pseudomonas sp. NPDC087612 TaxID=3364441 RepID=UPI0038054428